MISRALSNLAAPAGFGTGQNSIIFLGVRVDPASKKRVIPISMTFRVFQNNGSGGDVSGEVVFDALGGTGATAFQAQGPDLGMGPTLQAATWSSPPREVGSALQYSSDGMYLQTFGSNAERVAGYRVPAQSEITVNLKDRFDFQNGRHLVAGQVLMITMGTPSVNNVPSLVEFAWLEA